MLWYNTVIVLKCILRFHVPYSNEVQHDIIRISVNDHDSRRAGIE